MFENLKELIERYSDFSGNSEELEINSFALGQIVDVARSYLKLYEIKTPPYPNFIEAKDAWSAICIDLEDAVEELKNIIEDAEKIRDRMNIDRAMELEAIEEQNERQVRSWLLWAQ